MQVMRYIRLSSPSLQQSMKIMLHLSSLGFRAVNIFSVTCMSQSKSKLTGDDVTNTEQAASYAAGDALSFCSELLLKEHTKA